MKNESYRHHYIPQFIIKNFTEDRDGWIFYYDKSSDEISLKHSSEIFMYRNLYRDEINNPNDPTKIEKDLSVYEREVSEILNRFLVGDDFVITVDEEEKVKLFFAIMAFRSKTTSKKFRAQLSEQSKEFYSFYQEDGNMTDMWKRNLGALVKCRSIKEVMDSKDVDDPIKVFMMRDSFGIFGLHLVIGERRGKEDFFLSDVYPLSFEGESINNIRITMYSIIPSSPSRVLIMASNGVENAPFSVRVFSEEFLKKPPIINGLIKLHVKKLYQREVEFINGEIAKHYTEAAFLDKDRFIIR